jgi:GT2 family glycosyltransferase
MKTPVVFIIFNRPDTTAKVFEAIRQAKPPKLLVIADGPRSDRPDEAAKCSAARATAY